MLNMKNFLKNKYLYIIIFLIVFIFIIPTKEQLIKLSINNKLNMFEKNYESNKNLNIYLINYYSKKKNFNKRLVTDYYYLLNLNLPGIQKEQIYYKKKINVDNINKFENLLITKDCLNLSNKKIIKKNYKLIKTLENNCFFEKN